MSNPNSARRCSQRPMRIWQGCVVAVLASVGCSTTTAVQTVAKIAVTPTGADLAVHKQVTLQAVLTGAGGQVLHGPFVYWSSSDTSVAAVSSSGVVTGMSPGHAQIAASADGISGTASIGVSALAVASVTIVPDTLRVRVANTGQLLATAYNGSGHVVSGLTATWGSSNPAVATVSQSGKVTGVATGSSTVSASIGGRTGSAVVIVPKLVATVEIKPDTLTVTRGATGQLTATARDSSGQIVSGLTTTWASSNPAVATVDQNGRVAAIASGTSTVTATIGGTAGSAVVVVPVQVATVSITPDTLTLTPGTAGQLTATARDSSGKIVSGLTTTWSSSKTKIATVDPTGKVTGQSLGRVTISATIQAKTGTASVTVFALPPRTVSIAGCSGGTITETNAAPIIVTGDIDQRCHATITSTAGSIEVQGKVDHGSVVTLAGTAGIAIDHQITGGSTVNVTASGPFTVGNQIGGGPGVVVLTVADSDTLVVHGDISGGTQAMLHSHGPITIMGHVHDPGTQVVWWAPSFVVTGGVSPPWEAMKQNWGGFPDQY